MKNKTLPRGPGFLGMYCLFLCQVVQADVLVLKNGDRITGDIKRIWDAEISIEPDYSDEFKVDVSAVSHIESARQFEIELNDGRSIVAELSGVDADGNQIVAFDDEAVALPLAEFFELNEPEEEFDWESHVEMSANINKGNTETANARVRADTTVRFNDHRHIGEITFFREELAGVSTQEQDLFRYSYNWLFTDPWFFAANLTFEKDPIIELDSRVIVSAGIGRDIWDTPRRSLSVQLAGGYQKEQINSNATDSAVLTWALRYRQDFFSDDVELFHNHTITNNVSGRTNTSYRTSTGVGYEITDLLTTSLSLDFDYETDPVDVAENENIALLFGLGLEF